MAATSDTSSARLVITTDWDAGFRLTPGAKPLDDIPPGGEYVVECTARHDGVLADVTVRDFVLDRLYVGTLFASTVLDEGLVATGSIDDRRYRLEPPVSIVKAADIRAVLKNVSDAPKKPKIAMLLKAGEGVNAALKDWRVTGVHVGRATQPLAPSCPTCDSPDRDVRRQIGSNGQVGPFCDDAWHNAEARKVTGHAPKLSRTLYEGPGNATLVSGCSCGADVPNARAFADHVGLPESTLTAMLALVSIIYDFYERPTTMTREEIARRVARCLEFQT